MKSIIQSRLDHCFICDRMGDLHTHHVFGGGLRQVSEKYGMTVRLCPVCHLWAPYAVHRSAETDRYLKRLAQEAFMEQTGCSVDKFRKIFRKNYIEEDESCHSTTTR